MRLYFITNGQFRFIFHSLTTKYTFEINFVEDTIMTCWISHCDNKKVASRIMPKTREVVDEIEGNDFFSKLCDIYFNSSTKKISKDFIKEMVSEQEFNRLLLTEKFVKLGYSQILTSYLLSEYAKEPNWKKFLRFHKHKDLYEPYVKEYDEYDNSLENLLQINLDDLDKVIHRVKTIDNFKILKKYFRFSEIIEMKENYINFFLKQYNEPHPAKYMFGKSAYLRRCIALIKGCKELNCNIPTGNDWFSNYVTIYRRLQAEEENILQLRTKEIDKGFSEFQNAIDLNFEDDDYKVVVPQTYLELVNEGNALKNCLAHWEWDNRLRTHFYRVVFIRNKKELDKPFIACDITSDTNEIGQYYTYNNNRPSNEALAFRKKYQNYLDNLSKVSQENYKSLCSSNKLLEGSKASNIMEFFEE